MTKKELLEMLKDVKDDEKVVFIEYYHDRDGWWAERENHDIEKVRGEKA